MTLLGSILPGVGFWLAGRRRIAVVVGTTFVLLVVTGIYLATGGRRAVLHWLVQPDALSVVAMVLFGLAAAWVCVIMATWVVLRPSPRAGLRGRIGDGVVVVLALAVIAPFGIAGRYALIQKSLIEDVFASPTSKSATRPQESHQVGVNPASPASPIDADPWGGQDRVNVLLLGGDGGADRVGVRTDTMIVASVDTRTGATVLFSLPRNLQRVPFEPGSILARTYPDGRYAGAGDQLEWMLTSIYENVPKAHPGLLISDNPGADAVKMAVAGALGMKIDYYALVNLKGFEKLIDALGGITVNVNYPIAIGGEADAGLKPHAWIDPGPNQHFDGWAALWFARGRYGASDWDRMERQRCVIKAIVDQANPTTLLTRYEELARTSKDILQTDIPASMLPAFVDLSMKVKGTKLSNITFTRKVIHVANPDYTLIRSLTHEAIAASLHPTPTTSSFTDALDDVCAYKPTSFKRAADPTVTPPVPGR